MSRKIIAFDFDATITSGWGWVGGKPTFPPPLDGVKDALQYLVNRGAHIVIYTARTDLEAVREYLDLNLIPYHDLNYHPYIPNNLKNWKEKGSKLVADVYVDDKGFTFRGKWSIELAKEILDFSSWAKRGKSDDLSQITEEEGLRLKADLLGSSPSDLLQQCAALFKSKNGEGGYGNNYLRWGEIMTNFFPNGITLKTKEDWNKFGVFTMVMEKEGNTLEEEKKPRGTININYFGVQADQVAFFCADPKKGETMFKFYQAMNPDSNWVVDTVVAKVFFSTNAELVGQLFEAKLHFNYDIMPCEFELLVATTGRPPHMNKADPTDTGFSHVGFHVEDMDKAIKQVKSKIGTEVAFARVRTLHHSGCPYLYEYTLIDTSRQLGFVTKLIKRVE